MAIIGIDATLIGAYLTARNNLQTGTAVPGLLAGPRSAPDRGPAVIPPWEIPLGDSSLSRKIAGIRGLDNFIDLRSDSVLNSNGDADSKKLFAMYNALVKLRTLAEFAKSDLATTGLLASLDAKLQAGLTEIQGFVQSQTFEKSLSLIFGTKKDNVQSQAALGKFQTDYIGGAIQVGARDDPIAGLTGTEKFTLKLTRGASTDSIVIDLALMTDPLSISNIAKFINDQIKTIQVLDANNVLVPKYATRFNTTEVVTGQHAFKIKIAAGEDVSLSAADVQPSLVLTGTRMIPGVGNVETSFVNKLNDLSGVNPQFDYSEQIAAALSGGEATVFRANEGDVGVTSSPVADTQALAVVTDSNGNIFVVGGTEGDFDGQFNQSGAQDIFLSKYDAAGNLVFKRLLGADAQAAGFAIAVDSKDNVIVAGKSTANLTTTALIDNPDSFVMKFNNNGDELFTYQVQAGATDGALGLTVDASDDILISGFVDGQIDNAQTASGGRDAFFTKLSGVDGTVTFTHQFGTAGTDTATGIAIASDGNILVAVNENDRAVLRKFDVTSPSTAIFSVDLGALNGGKVTGLAVDGTAVYVTGFTSNTALAGTIANAHSGGVDGFVTRIDDAGASAAAAYTSYIGGTADDRARAVAVNGGQVYVVGHAEGALPGESLTGKRDGFVVKINGADGTQLFTKQFGAPQSNFDVNGVAFTTQGSSSLTALGLPMGKIETDFTRTIDRQTTVRPGDQFFISINGGTKRKITIDAGDSFITLASKINRLSFLNIKASSLFTSGGPKLKIEALRGATIDILAGPAGKDALRGLGITPGTLFDEPVPAPVPAPDEVGGIFGLELDRNVNLRSKKAAEFAFGALDLAAGIVQGAFRSLTRDPAREALKKLLESQASISGPVPQFLANQIANFQAGLFRLTNGSSTIGFF